MLDHIVIHHWTLNVSPVISLLVKYLADIYIQMIKLFSTHNHRQDCALHTVAPWGSPKLLMHILHFCQYILHKAMVPVLGIYHNCLFCIILCIHEVSHSYLWFAHLCILMTLVPALTGPYAFKPKQHVVIFVPDKIKTLLWERLIFNMAFVSLTLDYNCLFLFRTSHMPQIKFELMV